MRILLFCVAIISLWSCNNFDKEHSRINDSEDFYCIKTYSQDTNGGRYPSTVMLFDKDSNLIRYAQYSSTLRLEFEILYSIYKQNMGYGLFIAYDTTSTKKIVHAEMIAVESTKSKNIVKRYTQKYMEGNFQPDTFKEWLKKTDSHYNYGIDTY